MTEQQLYLNNQLTLRDLAHASGFSLHQVSAALNVAKDSCFYYFINALRVQGVAKLLLAHPARSVLDIADAGFNFKSLFYRLLKTYKVHPRAYRQQQLKADH